MKWVNLDGANLGQLVTVRLLHDVPQPDLVLGKLSVSEVLLVVLKSVQDFLKNNNN